MERKTARYIRCSLVISVSVSSTICFAQSPAPDPLSPRVLVVYASNNTDSQSVANDYAMKRAIPASNLCPVTVPDPTPSWLSYDDYVANIKTPVQNCLSTVGPGQILYIVLAFLGPNVVATPGGMNYALDSYLADVWDQYTAVDFDPFPNVTHPYYADSQSQGNVFQPFVPLAAYRDQAGALMIYSVWRLDGATPDLAKGLVDKAILAGSGGVSGKVYVDRRSGDVSAIPDASYGQGEWDLHQAAQLLAQGGFEVIEDDNDAEFGTSPAPLSCPYAVFYSGWYSYGNYNDVFSWNGGAIGFHLDSLSIAWSTAAVERGITATAGAVAEPYLEGLPRSGGLFRNLLEGANVGDAFLRNTRWIKWMVVNIGDPLYRPFADGAQGFNPPPPTTSFALSAREVDGGATSIGTITLASPAPDGGVTFSLSTGCSDAVQVPDTVSVSAGSTTVSFPVATTVVPSSVDCIVSAEGPRRLANTITVNQPSH